MRLLLLDSSVNKAQLDVFQPGAQEVTTVIFHTMRKCPWSKHPMHSHKLILF